MTLGVEQNLKHRLYFCRVKGCGIKSPELVEMCIGFAHQVGTNFDSHAAIGEFT